MYFNPEVEDKVMRETVSQKLDIPLVNPSVITRKVLLVTTVINNITS